MPISAYQSLLTPINQFLLVATPSAWIDEARKPENLSILLIDHMICELKAAQTACWLIRKYAVDQQSANSLLSWLTPYEQLIYHKDGSLNDLHATHQVISKQLIRRDDVCYSNDLIDKMVRLIKEELHHFYQVFEIMQQRNIRY